MKSNRRGFLSGVIGLGVAAWFAPRVYGSHLPDSSVAIIGCGQRGAALAKRWNCGYTPVVGAVYDLDPHRAEQLAHETGALAAPAWQPLLEDPTVQILAIATPDNTHLPFARAALAAGKQVHLELPACGPGEELGALAALDVAERIHVGISDLIIMDLAYALRQSTYGNVRHAQFSVAAEPRAAWQYDTSRSFGPAASALYSKAVLYTAMHGAGEPPTHATLQHDAAPGRVPTQLILSLRYADGSTAVFTTTPQTSREEPVVVHFESGSMELLPNRHRKLGETAWQPCIDTHIHEVHSHLDFFWRAEPFGDGPAVVSLRHVLPIHEVFARTLA